MRIKIQGLVLHTDADRRNYKGESMKKGIIFLHTGGLETCEVNTPVNAIPATCKVGQRVELEVEQRTFNGKKGVVQITELVTA